MPDILSAITRPNGKVYRPRGIAIHLWQHGHDDSEFGVYVLGIHDIDQARVLAAEAVDTAYAVDARPGWFRLGYCSSAGELTWLYDEERGRAGIRFTASDDPGDETDERAIP